MTDYSQAPQRLHKYPASEWAKEIVHEPFNLDTLFSGTWPEQWSSPEAPEFHDEMDKLMAAGFKTIGYCPSADGLGPSMTQIMKAAQFVFKKINERPNKYKIVRTTEDIDEAIKEKKLGIYLMHQGTSLFEADFDWVSFWRQLGYGYCLLAYNGRNAYGDGCFEPDNGRLTNMGKLLIDAYNRYGMIVDVSHVGERTSLDAIERSKHPVISSHSEALAVSDYPGSISDERIKAIAQGGGVCVNNGVGTFLDTSNPDIVTTDLLFAHIDHMVSLVGVDYVGYGSDYIPDMTFTADGLQSPLGQLLFPDGGITIGMGEKGVPTAAPYQVIAVLVDKFLEKGYSEEDCSKFQGGNMHRVFKQVWL